MGAISGGLEEIWNKKTISPPPPPPPLCNSNYDWSLIIEWAFPFFNQHMIAFCAIQGEGFCAVLYVNKKVLLLFVCLHIYSVKLLFLKA